MAEGGSKLSEEEIFECLKSLNVPVRMSDLKTPSKEFLFRVFDCFVKDLEIDLNSQELRSWEATNHLENPGICEEAVFLTLLTMTVNHIMNGLNITVRDIVEPKPKRTKKILNYILVFWNYYLQKFARFHAIEDIYRVEKKKAEDLIIENNSLDEKYKEMLDVLNNMQPNKEELSQIILVKEEKITKLEKECKTIQADYDALKVKETSLREEMSNADLRILSAKQTIEELRQLILSSPERIDVEIQKLHDKIKIEDKKIEEWENKWRDNKKKLQAIKDSKPEEEKDLKIFEDFTESKNSLREKVQEVVTLYRNISDKDDKVKKLQTEVDRKEETKLQLEQKSAKFVLNNRKHIETLHQSLKTNQNQKINLEADIESFSTSINNTQEKIDRYSDEILEVVQKLKEADAKTTDYNTQHIHKMREIHTSFKSDCDDILKCIKKKFPYEMEKEGPSR